MTVDAPVSWCDDIESDGGPVLVANVDDFAHWGGSKELARAHLAHEAIHSFGAGFGCYLRSTSTGSVRVSVEHSRNALWLAQIDYADNDGSRAAAHAHVLAFDGVQDEPGLHYRVSTGPVIVASATNDVADTSTTIDKLPLAACTPGALIDFASGPNAAAVWLTPGLYQSSLFVHEGDRWGVSWCRLQRVAD